jgi:hypothetical protein
MSSPFMTGNINNEIDTEDNELPTYKEYKWDFVNNHFMADTSGNHIIVTENEALKVWIYKTLNTERWRYRVYDNSYGIELEKFIGKANNQATADELKAYISEALLVNNYIKSIDTLDSTINGDKLYYDMTLTTIYGKLTVSNVVEES